MWNEVPLTVCIGNAEWEILVLWLFKKFFGNKNRYKILAHYRVTNKKKIFGLRKIPRIITIRGTRSELLASLIRWERIISDKIHWCLVKKIREECASEIWLFFSKKSVNIETSSEPVSPLTTDEEEIRLK
jgi:hypothetical protein